MRILCPLYTTVRSAQMLVSLPCIEYKITAADWLLTIRDNTRQLETVSVASSFRATRELHLPVQNSLAFLYHHRLLVFSSLLFIPSVGLLFAFPV